MLIMPPFSLTELGIAGELSARLAQFLGVINGFKVEALDQRIRHRIALREWPGKDR